MDPRTSNVYSIINKQRVLKFNTIRL